MSQDRIDWRADYPAALEEARRDGKLLVVHFTTEGRPACAAMEEETLRHADVVRASRERYVNVKLDAEKTPDLYRRMVGGRGGLATCVIDATGDVISGRAGYASVEEYVLFLGKAEAGYAALKAARERAKPEDAVSMAALGEAYLALDSRRRAEECFEKVVAQGKGPVESRAQAHERLSRLAVQRGRNVEARAHLAEARKLGGRADRLLLTEGMALSLERRHAEAAKLLEGALAAHPKGEELDAMKYALGFVLHQIPEDKRALEVLEGLVKEHPASVWVRAAKEQIGHIRNPQPDHTH